MHRSCRGLRLETIEECRGDRAQCLRTSQNFLRTAPSCRNGPRAQRSEPAEACPALHSLPSSERPDRRQRDLTACSRRGLQACDPLTVRRTLSAVILGDADSVRCHSVPHLDHCHSREPNHDTSTPQTAPHPDQRRQGALPPRAPHPSSSVRRLRASRRVAAGVVPRAKCAKSLVSYMSDGGRSLWPVAPSWGL